MMNNANVLFYDDDVECDMYNGRNKTMAHIECLGGDVLIICIECLNKIVLDAPGKGEI
jgi:phosphoribulokinase